MKISFCKIFFLTYLLTYAKSEEPHCSKYDFEEKILEKMVRMEFQMEIMKSEMEQTLKSVDLKLNKMDEKEAKSSYIIKTTQEQLIEDMEALQNKTMAIVFRKLNEMDEKVGALQNKTVKSVDRKLNEMDEKEAKSSYITKITQGKFIEKMEALQNKTVESIDQKLNGMDEKMEALQNKTDETVDRKLNEMDEKEAKISYTIKTTQEKFSEKIEALQNKATEVIDKKLTELQILKDQIVTPTVAFKAKLYTSTAAPAGQVIVFPTVLFNEGEAYSSQTGKFRATTNGTYLFTIAICLQYQKQLLVDILVDGVAYTRTHFRGHTNNACYTADTVAVLKAGQSVWVQSSNSGSGDILKQFSDAWNTFSGVLLHK